VILANSTFVAERIWRHWGRDAQVIHPPVEVNRFTEISRQPEDYYLFLGRLVPYKRASLAVAACAELDRPLKVVGTGRALETIRSAAGPRTEFLGHVSDEELPKLLAGAKALLFPGEEDFGIVPVEAQAAGLPVIAYGVGGAKETVLDGVTGVLFGEQSDRSLAEAIERFEVLKIDTAAVRANAERFGRERFRREMAGAIVRAAEVSSGSGARRAASSR
jgi:glycosyltransferase involved in cell wall biosynthesis